MSIAKKKKKKKKKAKKNIVLQYKRNKSIRVLAYLLVFTFNSNNCLENINQPLGIKYDNVFQWAVLHIAVISKVYDDTKIME